MKDIKNKWRTLSANQKLLVLVTGAVLVAAFLILLSIWGINIDRVLVGRIFSTCLLIMIVAGVLIMISSNMRDESKKNDKDNYFN